MKAFYKLDGNIWHVRTDKVINRNYQYDVNDYDEDTDLMDGWIFRLEPPQDYLDWLEEQEQENFE